jgi:hypothetical protein
MLRINVKNNLLWFLFGKILGKMYFQEIFRKGKDDA